MTGTDVMIPWLLGGVLAVVAITIAAVAACTLFLIIELFRS